MIPNGPAVDRNATLAKAGSLDLVIGLDEETRRIMQVLSRRTRGSAVVIGADDAVTVTRR